jgi:hypothetical protein
MGRKNAGRTATMKRTMGSAGILALLLLIGGCASKEDRALYAKIRERSPELETIQQSDKVVFHPGEDGETIVIATYLSRDNPSYETFALSVHPSEGLAAKDPFRLDGKPPESLRRISRRELPERVRRTSPETFPIYRVRSPRSIQKRITLASRDNEGEEKKLTFYRGPKYLITKPEF